MYDFDHTYTTYLVAFEAELKKTCEQFSDKSPHLKQAMAYSLLLGGKRMRPVLMLAAADILNVPQEDVMPFAVALEIIHLFLDSRRFALHGRRRFQTGQALQP